MPLSNPFRRTADHPTLRERAAALRASLRPASLATSPAPIASDPILISGDADLLALAAPWQAATAAYDRALQNQIAVSNKASTLEAPPAREPHEQWVRLIPGWRERTGVDAAETAARDAVDVVNEIEDRIAALPATTMAGLRLKARVAERSDRFEIVWPDGFGEGLVRDILAMGEPEIEADAELIRLGHLFEAAREREAAACEACNEALREAQQHLPQRPVALVFRASDHPLRLRKYLTHPDHLEGEEVTAEDIAWMRRKPYVREIRRPVRPEDSLPASARTVVDSCPWPEAQDRADEIVTAWDAWQAEQAATHSRYVTEALDNAAVEAGEATAALADRIADLPAHTAAGFRAKLRALAHYRRDVLDAEVADEPDPDHTLSHSLWRDVQGDLPATRVANGLNLVSLIDFTSATMSELLTIRNIAGCIGDVAYAHAWGARCRKGANAWGGVDHNEAGKLVNSLGDALTAVESAAEREAKRRTPDGEAERSTRLYMLAPAAIDNGAPDEIEAFARELLTHAAADREGR